MGFQHVRLIFDPLIPDLTTSQALVLVTLAWRADNKHTCYPGLALIAKESRLTKRWVVNTLMELEEKKLIKKLPGNRDNHYKSIYEMTYAVEPLKKLEQEVKPQRQFKSPYPAPPAMNGSSLTAENEDFLQRLYNDLATKERQQENHVQATGRPNPLTADVILDIKSRIAKLETKKRGET